MSHQIQNLASLINQYDIKHETKLINCDKLHTIVNCPDSYHPTYKMDGAIHCHYDQTNDNHQIGSYVLDRVIGRGNFSVVKLGIHIPTKMQVAIKVLHKTKMSNETLGKTYREVQIMKQLSHANIVKLYQVIESQSWMFIIMEYVSHGELFDYLSKVGKLTENEARIKFSQILDAVEYCHNMKIVHRDLKAENLLMDDNLNIKLADFGFGSFYNDSYLLSTWCGSPPYAAPELFIGEPYIGPKADIWSLGVVLYAMVCGKLPFDEPCSIVKLREQVLLGWVRFPYFLSYECEHLIRSILNRDPIKRPSIKYIKDHKWMQPSFDESLALIVTSPFGDSDFWQAPTRDRSSRRCNTVGADSGFEEPLDFIKSYSERNSLSINNNCTDFDVSDRVLRIMEQCGFNRSTIIDELKRNTYGHSTATYLLLCEKLRVQRLDNSTSSSGHFTPPSSYMVQAEFMPQELLGEAACINNPSTTPTCQLSLLRNRDFCLRKIQIDDINREILAERSSLYDNVVKNANKTPIQFYPIVLPQSNIVALSKPALSLATKREMGDINRNIEDHHANLVVLNLIMPHDQNDANNTIRIDHRHKVSNYDPEKSQSGFEAAYNPDPFRIHLCSLTNSQEMKTNLMAQTCPALTLKSSIQNNGAKPIPKPSKGTEDHTLATNGRHPVLPQPAVVCQISSLYNVPNDLIYGHGFYSHDYPLKSNGFNVDSPTMRPHVNNFFDMPISHVRYDQARMMLPATNAHVDQNGTPGNVLSDRQVRQSSPLSKVDHRQCLANCSLCPRNIPYIEVLPTSDDRPMIRTPCLSSANRARFSHSESFSQNIAPCNISRVSQISPVNINLVPLS